MDGCLPDPDKKYPLRSDGPANFAFSAVANRWQHDAGYWRWSQLVTNSSKCCACVLLTCTTHTHTYTHTHTTDCSAIPSLIQPTLPTSALDKTWEDLCMTVWAEFKYFSKVYWGLCPLFPGRSVSSWFPCYCTIHVYRC